MNGLKAGTAVLDVPTPQESEYRWPDEIGEDQARFLWAISSQATDVLKDLKVSVADQPPDQRAEALVRWADEYCLNAPWLLEIAERTVEVMADPERWNHHRKRCHFHKNLAERAGFERPYDPDWLWFTDRVVASYALDEDLSESRSEPFRFEFRAAHPAHERLGDYMQEATAAFKKAVRNYWMERCREIEEAGAERTKPKRASAKWDHIRWFVRFQVLGETHDNIGASVNMSSKKIAAACRDVSERIRLTRRTVASGTQ